LSTALIKKHDLVVAEELRSKNLLKNHALSQAISDVGWRRFLNMLAYKAKLYGKEFQTIDPKYTTQRCHNCGTIMGQNGCRKLKLKDREWTCPMCQTYHIRDWNAAVNILEKGLGSWKNPKNKLLKKWESVSNSWTKKALVIRRPLSIIVIRLLVTSPACI
ncbi:transposase, partial [Lactobacillus helveticus MTCC 5463]